MPQGAGTATPATTGFVASERPRWVARATEDAEADRKVTAILAARALTDMRAVRAAQTAYHYPDRGVILDPTTPAEARVLDELIANVARNERAAMLEIAERVLRDHNVTSMLAVLVELRSGVDIARGSAIRGVTDEAALCIYHRDSDDATLLRPQQTVTYPAYRHVKRMHSSSNLFVAE